MTNTQEKPETTEKQIPTVDDAMLVELFTTTGKMIQAEDTALAAEEAELSRQLAAVQRERSKTQLSLRALGYVDAVHNNIALTVRPMALNLVRFLANPHSAFSTHSVPERYEDTLVESKDFASKILKRMAKAKNEPSVKPLDEANVIAVYPSTAAMSVWVGGSMPLHKPTVNVKISNPACKAIVLGFDSGWYVCPLMETSYIICGKANAPQGDFRRYKTRDGAIKAAYNYATTAKLTARKTIPPELEDVYKKSLEHQAEWQAWRDKKKAEREAAGKPEPGMFEIMSNVGKKEDGQPDDFTAWLA